MDSAGRVVGRWLLGVWESLGCFGRGLTLLALVSALIAGLTGGLIPATWTLFAFWVLANALMGLKAVAVSLTRPRLWASIASIAFGWSFIGAFLSAILMPVWMANAASRAESVAFGGAFLLLMAGISFGLSLICGFFVSLFGAGLGLAAAAEAEHAAARWGLMACWGWQAVGLLLALLGVPAMLVLTVWLGVPLLTVLTVRQLVHGRWLHSSWQWARQWLRRLLVIQRGAGARRRTLDLRGAAIGVTIGLLTWLVWQSGVLMPLQANSLIWLIRFRNEPWVQERRGMSLALGQTQASSRIVLLQHDQQSYAAIEKRSECAVLAQAIRQLRVWRARLLLVPIPLLAAGGADSEPARRVAQRNRRDLNLLMAAAREAGNVVWVVPSAQRLPPEARSLIRTGKAVGSLERVRYLAPALPVLERSRRFEAPPLAALQLIDRRAYERLQVRFVPTEFYGDQPGEVFLQVPLACVLTRPPLYWLVQRRTERDGLLTERTFDVQAMPTHQLFENRIVLLPYPLPELYQTPIGRMDAQQLMAHQLASLLDGHTGRGLSAGWVGLVLLALGLISGSLCLRRTPLEAWWIALLIALVVWLFSLALFLVERIWLDPLLPVLSVALTVLLVSQMAFVSESAERARHRALLQRLVAPEVAEQLLEDIAERLSPGGQRCRVGVLFADIRNFTRFAETHTSEQVIERLNRYLSALTDALHAHQGILDKYTGDGLMALFAAHLLPEPESDTELICRSVRAAIAMQHALQQVAVDSSAGAPLGIGIGLHFGEAVLGLLGSPHQFNYTAVGGTVVIAARLQALAAAGEIVMSEVVYRAAREAGVVPDLPPETVQLKGMTAPFVIYRLRAPAPSLPLFAAERAAL